VSEGLCGASAPRHFRRRWATVVSKLLNMRSADLAYLGQKTFSQLAGDSQDGDCACGAKIHGEPDRTLRGWLALFLA